MPETKRRLPVLKPSGGEAPRDHGGDDDDEPARPPWHWIGFGTTAIFAAWLPLAYAAAAIQRRIFAARFGDIGSAENPAAADAAAEAVRRLPPGEAQRLHAIVVALTTVPLAIAAFAGGYLIGRWAGAVESSAHDAANAPGATEVGASASPMKNADRAREPGDGRRASRGAGVREAALAGVTTAFIAAILAFASASAAGGAAFVALVIPAIASALVAVPFAAWGGVVGRRKRAALGERRG